MKKLTQILTTLTLVILCLSFVMGCAGDNSNQDNTTTTAATTTKQTTTTTTIDLSLIDPDKGDKEDDGRISSPTVEAPADGKIATAEQLHAVLVEGDPKKDYTVTAAELDMAKYTWTGLYGYKGIFDFGGCVVKNAKDSFFNSVDGGTVKNLTVKSSNFYYDDDMASEDFSAVDGVSVGNKMYSPIVRYATDIKISNIVIESDVTIEASIYQQDSHHGGIVGETVGSYVEVTDCVFKGTYINDSMLVNFGGIVGKMLSADTTVVNVEEPEKSTNIISGCFNYGKLEHKSEGEDSKVGGIVGYAENVAIIGCANYGSVKSNDEGQCAGIAGYAGGAIYVKNCLNTGAIEGVDAVGGICGYSNGEIRYFTNCINIGKISGTERVGGMVGMMKNKETLTNCFNLSSAYATFSLDADTNVIDPNNKSTHGNLTITNCDNIDSVANILSLIGAVAPDVFAPEGNSIVIK